MRLPAQLSKTKQKRSVISDLLSASGSLASASRGKTVFDFQDVTDKPRPVIKGSTVIIHS